ncbi:MAG TPA: biotin/lipoate A/B protein ligase family protein [Rectinemataceae bacterium]|nr:biotin/lipoate A/B protein ligase family protein [Rectinemataceae bacterium]
MRVRLLRDGELRPARHFAIEEAILRGVAEGSSPPTLRIRRSIPAVWIGLFQRPEEDVDVEVARALDVPIIRRYNPGGAVYQDEGTLCYSLFFSKAPFFESLGIEAPASLYSILGGAAIRALRRFGAAAELSPVNDVTIGGRKVYGSAQVEHYSAFVHSGSFLLSCDLDRMATLLRPSALKYADRGFSSVRERVINLSELAGSPVSPEAFAEALVTELSVAMCFELVESGLTEREYEETERLLVEKYGRPEWTYRRGERSARVLSRRSPSGVMTLAATLDGNRIERAELRGDFLVADLRGLESWVASLAGLSIPEAIARVTEAGLPADLATTLVALLEELS